MNGQLELIDIIEQEINQANTIEKRTELAAKEFVKDLNRLGRPRSKINKSGYTHLVDTFAYRKNKDEYEVGWGKYYGPMVERGTKKMRARPHLISTFKNNQEKYYKILKNN